MAFLSKLFLVLCFASMLVECGMADSGGGGGGGMLLAIENYTVDAALDAFNITNAITEVFGDVRIASTDYVNDNFVRLRRELDLDGNNKTTEEPVKDNVVEHPDGAVINGTFKDPDASAAETKFNVTYVDGEVNYITCTEKPDGKCDKDYALVPDDDGKLRVCVVPRVTEGGGDGATGQSVSGGGPSLAKALFGGFGQRGVRAADGDGAPPFCLDETTKIEFVIRTTAESGKYATKVESKSSDILVIQLIRSMVV